MKKSIYLLLVLIVLSLGTTANAETRRRTVYMSNSSGQMQPTGTSIQPVSAVANSGAATVIKRTGTRLVHQQKLTTDLLYNWAKSGNNTQLQNYQKYLNMRNEDGKTALCLAQEARDTVAYRRLLYWGADKDQSCKCSDKPCALWVNNNSNLALWGIIGVGAAVGAYTLLDGDKHKCNIKNYKLNLCPDHGYCKLCSYKFKLTSCDENWQMNADETECVPVACKTNYSSSIKSAADCGTAGELGWRIIQDTEQAYSGDEACYRCEKLDCNSGYTSSIQEVTQCPTTGDSGYEMEQDTTRYEGDTPCNKCVPDGCENNGETSYPDAESCPTYTYLKKTSFEVTDYDGDNVCGLCHYDCNEMDEAYVLGKCPEGKLCRQAEINASNGSTVTCEVVYDNDCSDYPYEERCPTGMHETERCTDQKGLHLDCEPDDCSAYPSPTCEITGFEEKDNCVTSSDGNTTTTTYQCQCKAIEGWTTTTCRVGHICRESTEAGIICYKEEECDENSGYYAEYQKCKEHYVGYDCVLDVDSECYIKDEELECDITDGYSTQYQSVADCGAEGGIGYTYTFKGYSGPLKCGKCTPKICTDYDANYITQAQCTAKGAGYTWTNKNVYAGDTECGECTPKVCTDYDAAGVKRVEECVNTYPHLKVTINTSNVIGMAGDDNCYKCEYDCKDEYYKTSSSCTSGNYTCTSATENGIECWWHTGCPSTHPSDQPCPTTQGKQVLVNEESIQSDVGICYKCEYACDTNDYPHLNTCPTNLKEADRCEDGTGNHLKCICDESKGYYADQEVCQNTETVTTCNKDNATDCYYPICNADEQTSQCATRTGMKLTETSRTLTNDTPCYTCTYACDPDQDRFPNTTEGIAACKAKYPSKVCENTETDTGCIIPGEETACPDETYEDCTDHIMLITNKHYDSTINEGTSAEKKCYTCSYDCNQALGFEEDDGSIQDGYSFTQKDKTCVIKDDCSILTNGYPSPSWFSDEGLAIQNGHCNGTINIEHNGQTCYHCKCDVASGWYSEEDIQSKISCEISTYSSTIDVLGCYKINFAPCPDGQYTEAQCAQQGYGFSSGTDKVCIVSSDGSASESFCGTCSEIEINCSQYSTNNRTYVNSTQSCPAMFRKKASTIYDGCYFCEIIPSCGDTGYASTVPVQQCNDSLQALTSSSKTRTFEYYESETATKTKTLTCMTCLYDCKEGWTKLAPGETVPEGSESVSYADLNLSTEGTITCYRPSTGDDCDVNLYRYVGSCPEGTKEYQRCTKDNTDYFLCECDNNYGRRGYYNESNINTYSGHLVASSVTISTNLRTGAEAITCYEPICNTNKTENAIAAFYESIADCEAAVSGLGLVTTTACRTEDATGCIYTPACYWGAGSNYYLYRDGYTSHLEKNIYKSKILCESFSHRKCEEYEYTILGSTCYVSTDQSTTCDDIKEDYSYRFNSNYQYIAATSSTASSADCGINENEQNGGQKTGTKGYTLGTSAVTTDNSYGQKLICVENNEAYYFYPCIPNTCRGGYSTVQPTCDGVITESIYDDSHFAGDNTCWACICKTPEYGSSCSTPLNITQDGFVVGQPVIKSDSPTCCKYVMECYNSIPEAEYQDLSDEEKALYDSEPITASVTGTSALKYEGDTTITCYVKLNVRTNSMQRPIFSTVENISKIELTSYDDEDVIGLASVSGKNLLNTVNEKTGETGEINIVHNSTGTAIGMYLSDANEMRNDAGASINIHSTNEENTSIGMYASTGGTVLNSGDINITGFSNKAYGIYGEGANKIKNSGNILVAGKNAYGIYVEDGTGTTVTNTETGVIDVHHAEDGEGWGIYINSNSGDAEVNNLGTININGETKDGTSGIYLNGAELHNAGVITTAGALDLNSLGGKIYLEDGGVYEAESLTGDLTAGVASVKEGNKDEYIIQSAVVSDNVEELNVLSQSALFNAELRQTEGTTGYDVVQTRRDFTEVSPNSSIGVYLDKNYIEGSTPELYEDLKSETNEKTLNRKVARVTGADVLPNIVDENMIALKSLNRGLADNILEPTNDPYRVVAGADTASVDAGGKGVLSGYDMNASSMWMYGDKRLNNWNRLGLGLALTKINTSYDVGADRKLDIIQLFIPYMHKFTDRLRLASILSAGYGFGDMDRSYKDARSSDLKDIFAGFTNELRYTMNLGCFAELEPALMLNALGYYEEGLDEGNASEAIITKNTKNLSIEAGAGLFLKKKVSLEKFGRLGFKIGGVYYRELTSPYDGISAHHKGANGWYTINDYAHLYQKDRALLEAAINYDYKAFTLELKYNKLIQKNEPEMLDLGLKYRF